MTTRQLILAGVLVCITFEIACFVVVKARRPEPVTEMSASVTLPTHPLPASVELIGQAGAVSIYSVKYKGTEFLVTSVGEAIPLNQPQSIRLTTP